MSYLKKLKSLRYQIIAILNSQKVLNKDLTINKYD